MERPYAGPERRLVDPARDRLSPYEHAIRLHSLNPERALRFSDQNEKFGGGVHRGLPYTGDDMRRALESYLFTLDLKISPHILEFLGRLEVQYPDALKTLQFLGCLQEDGTTREGDASVPSFEHVRKAFTFEELEAARAFEEPTLLLLPEGPSFADLIHAINSHKTMPHQLDAFVNEEVFGNIGTRRELPKIQGYRPIILEGAREMSIKPGDDPKLQWGDRLKARRTARQGSIKGMDRMKSVFLMAHSLRDKNPVDRRTWTILDHDPALNGSYVPCSGWGGWGAGWGPGFGADHPGYVGYRGRFRSSVGGDVLCT